MPKIDWPTFLKRNPAGHLVVAGVPIDTQADLGSRHLQTLHGRLAKLLTRLAPGGAYSLTIVRLAGGPEIHAAFEKSEDADRLARVVGARPDANASAASPGWASRRSFVLDDATGAAIAASLATGGEVDERERASASGTRG